MKKKEMSLFEKWKNRETKKKILQENIRLKAEIEALYKIPESPVCTVERNVQKICASCTINGPQIDVASEIVKHELLHKLTKHLSNFVEYDFSNDRYGNMTYKAILYAVTVDRRHES